MFGEFISHAEPNTGLRLEPGPANPNPIEVGLGLGLGLGLKGLRMLEVEG